MELFDRVLPIEYDEYKPSQQKYVVSNNGYNGQLRRITKAEALERMVLDVPEKDKPLYSMKLPKLRIEAKSRGIKDYTKMKKAELLKALAEGQNILQ